MHTEPKALLKNAILQCLPVLNNLVGVHLTPHEVWSRSVSGNWSGTIESRPDLMQVYIAASSRLEAASRPFVDSFFRYHPEYNGLVGFPMMVGQNFEVQSTFYLSRTIAILWDRHGKFDVELPAVEAVVNDFESFVDQPIVPIRFRALLANFSMSQDAIDLPDDLRIRRLTENEFTATYGGTFVAMIANRHRGFVFHEFVIEGQTEERKVFGNTTDCDRPAQERVRARLNRAILALRTFKAEPVGYQYVDFSAVGCCPIVLPSFGLGDSYVPFGRYFVDTTECSSLIERMKLVCRCSEPSMEMACSRLADAAIRVNPRDRLVDAVIGMEALLLAGLGKDDRRGELKFRFSLHYSTLFGTSNKRRRAFRLAKDLYDLRSTVAHGNALDHKSYWVGDEKLELNDASRRAVETLRHIVTHFLPLASEAPYRKHEFWESAYFGIPASGDTGEACVTDLAEEK